MQTYYVLLHMRRPSPDLRGAIINRLRDFIDVSRDMIASIENGNRLFFNENALKGVKAVVDMFSNSELQLYVVGIPEDEDIHMYSDSELAEFLDVIEVYPNMDTDRIDALNHSFKKSGSDRVHTFDKGRQVNVERVANTVGPLIDANSDIIKPKFERASKFEASHIEFGEDDLIAKELPNRDKVYSALDASLTLDDDSPLAEVVVSQAESNLAIMRTLMADDLEDVDSIDFDRVNASVYEDIKSSPSAFAYLESDKELRAFLDQANEEQEEISSRYERTMHEYLAPLFKKMEDEYRSKVPDNTDVLLQDYLQSIEPKYVSLKEAKENKRRVLSDSIMIQFAKTDGSKAAKALMKFLTLKSEITNSTIRSINKLKHSNDQVTDNSNEINALAEQKWQIEQARYQADQDLQRLEQARRDIEQERLTSQQVNAQKLADLEESRKDLEAERKEIEAQKQDLAAQRREAEEYVERQTAELQRLSSQLNEAQTSQVSQVPQERPAQVAQEQPTQAASEEAKTAAAAQAAELFAQQAETQEVKADERKYDTKVHEIPIDVADTFTTRDNDEINEDEEIPTTSSVDLDDIDMTQDEIAGHDESEVMFEDDEDEEDDSTSNKKKKKSGSSFFKKLSMPAKIGIGVGTGLAVLVTTFGILALTSSSEPTNKDPKTQQESGKSKEVEPLFSVGDTLTINDANGDSLDVVLKEFKEDGSAIAEDSNKGKWLITYDQMKDYLKQHPEKDQKSKSSDKSKTDSSKTETKSDSTKSENKSETKTETESSKSENAGNKSDNSVHADAEEVHHQDETAYSSESGLKS